MKKTQWLDGALTFSPIPYTLCIDEKSFNKTLKSIGIPKCSMPPFEGDPGTAAIHQFASTNGGLIAIIVVGDMSGMSLNEVHSLLVHEAEHLWRFIKKAIGERKPSAEFEAYSIQSISLNLMDAYDEAVAKQSKESK
jgi:hypothetical protein